MINYYLRLNPLTKDDKNDFRAQVINQETYTENDLANDLVEYNLGISKPQALAMLEAVNEILNRQFKKGRNVSLQSVNFRFTIPGAYQEKELPAHAELRATPTKEAAEAARTAPIKHALTPKHIRIDFIHDVKTNTSNEKITQGGTVKIGGHNLKIAGNASSVCVEFINVNGGSIYQVQPQDIITNNPGELVIIAPKMVIGEKVEVHVTTQYSGNSRLLKVPRSVTFERELTVTE